MANHDLLNVDDLIAQFNDKIQELFGRQRIRADAQTYMLSMLAHIAKNTASLLEAAEARNEIEQLKLESLVRIEGVLDQIAGNN